MVSIIIVNYHVKKDLFACIESIYTTKPKSSFEIIVVDNDEKKTIAKDLHKQFPKVKYIPNENNGYGQGINVGAKQAKGEYLFILNPDTKMYPKCLDILITYLNKHKDTGVTAPFLYESEKQPVKLQGARVLTPLFAIFSFSFIHKLFPQNPITQKYWYFDSWNGKSDKTVESVPGGAFVIRRKIFDKVGGFDEKFFLFFEEQDLSKRVSELGVKQVMLPHAKIYHAHGKSMKQSSSNIEKIFKESRFYYFKKHFGMLQALLTELILRTGKTSLFILLILGVGTYLRISEIERTMVFLGDQGWFYLSARDMVFSGQIPLVGIASSHPWLHQGAFWTYLLAPVLWLFQFNPISGAYLSSLIGIITIYTIYKVGSLVFSKNVGVISAALFATSPLIIFFDRMPYHTSPIPLVTIISLYCLYKWISGNKYYFPVLIAMLAVLYNFELATFLLSIMVLFILSYGIIKKKKWALTVFEKKIMTLTITGWLFVMLPMIIYDFSHGFSQTIKFLVWIGYRILVFLGYSPINPIAPVSNTELFGFILESLNRLIYANSLAIALFILAVPVILVFFNSMKKQKNITYLVLVGINIFLLCGLWIVKTPSLAYFPLLFPSLMIAIAFVFDKIIGDRRVAVRILGLLLLVFVLVANGSFLIKHNYSFVDADKEGFFKRRLGVAKEVIQQTEGRDYNLIGKVDGKQHENFMKSYAYLTWWLGHGPSQQPELLEIVVEEKQDEIFIQKKEGEKND